MSFLPIFVMTFILAYGLQQSGFYSFQRSLLNVIPLCIISSSIAIPSVRALRPYNKEFVIYESSLSDIIGVLFFNFLVLNDFFGAETFGLFGLEMLIMIVVSFVAIVGLAFLLNRIEHHIKFVPIILLVVLIYAVSKMYHLPALVFILLYGLCLGNLDELKKLSWIKHAWILPLEKELPKFKDMIAEIRYPEIETSHLYVDALAMQMIRKPELFEVIVTNNMFGDIITDLGAALQGGLGVAASANLHPGRTSMFEPVHGSAPKYAGTGRANPLAAILTAGLLLDNLGHAAAAAELERTVKTSIREGRVTADLGGSLSTAEVGDRIAGSLAAAEVAAT
jgi:hypothetical protein